MFYVTYEVNGFDGIHKAGPYACIELAWENLDDIKGYEGVCNARVMPAEEVDE